jgi:hypothetical protein
VKDMKIQVLSIEDVTNETKINGIVFEANVYSSLSSDTKNALLDKDEIDGLLQTLNYFKDKVIGTSPSDYTEVIFSSRSGFSASIFQYQKDWSIAFKLERYGSNSSVYFKSKDLPELINLVGQAKARL